MPKLKRKTNRIRVSSAAQVARKIGLPEAQIANDDFVLTDVSNHSDAEQRHMVRSGEKKTVRRTTKIDQLHKRGIIDKREALACEWYQATYEEQYETRIKIADWGATGGSSDRAYGHWPVGAPLERGLNMYEFAREAINPAFVSMFERVVLHGRPLGKLAITFRSAARSVLKRIEGIVELS